MGWFSLAVNNTLCMYDKMPIISCGMIGILMTCSFSAYYAIVPLRISRTAFRWFAVLIMQSDLATIFL